MKMKVRTLLLLSAATLLLASCRIVVDTNVRPDGSGELRTSVVFSEQEREDFSEKPENQGKGICDNIENDVPTGAKFVEEIHDGETFCVTERPFSNLAELRTSYAGMQQVTINTLQLESGRFTVDLDVDLSDKDNGGALSNEWQLTLPGQIGSQNADRVEGQTLIWVIAPGEKKNLHAESEGGVAPVVPDSSNSALILVAAGILVLGFLIGLAAFTLMRRKRNTNSFSGVL